MLTGPPGGGKSTALMCLASKGYAVLPEVHRWMRVFQVIESGTADAAPSMPVFPSASAESQLAFELFRGDTDQGGKGRLIFMDRSIIDFLAYCLLYSSCFAPAVQAHARRQAPRFCAAFYIDNCRDGNCSDWLRREGRREKLTIGAAICRAYADCGVPLVRLPPLPPERTAATILDRVGLP